MINITEIYSLFYKKLFYISFSIIRDRHLAEDAVQETFIKVMKKINTIEDETKLAAWLSVTVRRTAIDFVRRDKKKTLIPMDQEILESFGMEMKQKVEKEVETHFWVEEMNHAFRKLNLEYQNVLMLKVERGLKDSEIAKVLDLHPCTVRSRIHRARKQLRILFFERVSA